MTVGTPESNSSSRGADVVDRLVRRKHPTHPCRQVGAYSVGTTPSTRSYTCAVVVCLARVALLKALPCCFTCRSLERPVCQNGERSVDVAWGRAVRRDLVVPESFWLGAN